MKFMKLGLLIFFILLIDKTFSFPFRQSSKNKYNDPNVLVIKKMRLGVASITLANIFKRLGSKSRTLSLAIRIQKRCKGKKLLNDWLRIIKYHRRMIINSTKLPFKVKRLWYVYHPKRKSLLKHFLKTFIRCGKVKGTKFQIRRIYKAYFSANYIQQHLLVRLIYQIKRIFMRKKRVYGRYSNNTIYPTRILLKMIQMRRYIGNCLKYKNECLIYGNHCHKYRFVCKFASNFRDGIIYKVRRIFAYYFSVLFSGLIKVAKYRKVKLNLRKNTFSSSFFYNTPY